MGNEPAGGVSQDEPNLFRPDTVIMPDRVAPAPTAVSQPQVAYQQPTPTVHTSQPPVEPVVATPITVSVPQQPELPPAAPAQEPSNMAEPSAYMPAPGQANEGAITWTASEFIAHSKSSSWYGLLAIAAGLMAVLVWLITRDIFVTVMVVAGVFLLGVYAGRQPKQEAYTLDDDGLDIGNRHYGFADFHSFAITVEGELPSIELVPLKRLATPMTIYFDPADEEAIVGMLSMHLPMENPHANLTDSLMRRIHF